MPSLSTRFGKSVISFNFDIKPGSENDIFSMKWVISQVSLILQRALMSTCLTRFWAWVLAPCVYLQYQEWSEPMSSCTSRILFICSIKNDRNLFFQTCLNGARRRRRTGAVPLASPEIEFQSGWIFKCFYGWNRRSHITHLKIITTASAICLKSNKGIRYAKNTMMPPILPRHQKMVKLWVTLGPLKLVQNQKSFWILSN